MTRRAGFQEHIAPRARRLPVEHPARVVLMHPLQHVHQEVLTRHLSAGPWGESEGCHQAARCTGSVGLPRKRRCATVHVGTASPARCCSAESVTLHASQVVRRTKSRACACACCNAVKMAARSRRCSRLDMWLATVHAPGCTTCARRLVRHALHHRIEQRRIRREVCGHDPLGPGLLQQLPEEDPVLQLRLRGLRGRMPLSPCFVGAWPHASQSPDARP